MTSRSAPPRGSGHKTSLHVRIEWGASYELLATVSAFLYTGHHTYYDLGRSWFERITAEAPAAVSQLRSFAGGSVRIWDHLIGLATEAGPQHETGAFADYLARMDAEVLRLDLLGRRNRPVQRAVGIERIVEAAAGSATAQRDFMRLAWPEDAPWQMGLRQLLKASAGETKEALIALLRALDRDMSRYVDPLLPALEADAMDKHATAATLDPLALIRSAIDTAYTPTGDVAGVVLIPSFVIRPYVYFFEHADQMVFLYPVADRFTGPIGAGPPERLVKLAQALGDRGRLQILGALKERDMSVKELGAMLGLPRSTLRHHLGVLRLAGLIRPMQIGTGFPGYQLREEAATDLVELVDRFLRTS
jgi:DNA-binding transcriptional ArsR family regulator